MNISHLKNKNIHFIECENWRDVYGYEKTEMKEDTINYIEQLQKENKKQKEVIDKVKEFIYIVQNNKENKHLEPVLSVDDLDEILDILKEV